MTAAVTQAGNIKASRQVFALFAQGDIDGLAELLHPDVQAHPSIGGDPVLEGRDAVVDWWRGLLLGDRDALEARPLEFSAQGDCVIVRGYLRHREGRTLAENQVFWIHGFRDGLIDRMESYPTRASALAAC